MIVHSFCDNWEFTRHWTEAFGKGLPVPKQQTVRLPHNCRELPRLFLRFDGAAHQASVFVNGKPAGAHAGGYAGFELEITDLVDRDSENLLTVKLDTREDPSIPPFGCRVVRLGDLKEKKRPHHVEKQLTNNSC